MRLGFVLVLSLLMLSFAPPVAGFQQSNKSNSSSSAPIFVWYFGYVGDVFYPGTQLGISTGQMVSVAQSLSGTLGTTTRLVFVSAIDQTPGNIIQWKDSAVVNQLLSYVLYLQTYGQVYGRIDLEQFNTTGFGGSSASTSAYTEVGYYTKMLNLNGVWLDHASVLYNRNPALFNAMMQNLTESYPALTFILNQTFRQTRPSAIIVPAGGTTWAKQTYLSPTVSPGSYNKIPPLSLFAKWNQYYPGRVLVHYDSYAKSMGEPMGQFAAQSSQTEIQTIQALASEGASLGSKGFTLLYPVMGAWTYNGVINNADYYGTLYNSFMGLGANARSTLASFTQTMQSYP
jgi:hypothetical protein